MARYISKDSLEKVKLLLEKDTEDCGYIEDSKIISDIKEAGKKSCIQNIYKEYIWHTHPKYNIGYPSGEDIVKILKFRNLNIPKTSLIFTSWGIWEISAENKIKLSQKNISEIIESVNKFYNHLYPISERGRIFNPNILEDIVNINKKICNYFKVFLLKISFTPWQVIGNVYILN